MLLCVHMEPSTTPDYSGESAVKTVTKSNLLMICDPLCHPTPVSKILAAVLFIILPFIGAYVGYQLAGEDTVPKFQEVTSPENTEDVNVGNAEVVENDSSVDVNWPYQPYATDTLRYVLADQNTDDFWQNKNNYSNSIAVKGVHFVDSEAQKVSSAPFLRVTATVPNGYVLTLPCFIESECGNGGLFKYDEVKKEVTTMKGGAYYYPMTTGDYRSPDGTKIAVTKGFTLGVIDLMQDTFTAIKTFEYTENKTFSLCEMGCQSDIRWSDSQTLSAQVFEYERCDKDGMCMSTFTDTSSGLSMPSTMPIATSTQKFSL